MTKLLTLDIVTQEKRLLTLETARVTVETEMGEITVLPGHIRSSPSSEGLLRYEDDAKGREEIVAHLWRLYRGGHHGQGLDSGRLSGTCQRYRSSQSQKPSLKRNDALRQSEKLNSPRPKPRSNALGSNSKPPTPKPRHSTTCKHLPFVRENNKIDS